VHCTELCLEYSIDTLTVLSSFARSNFDSADRKVQLFVTQHALT